MVLGNSIVLLPFLVALATCADLPTLYEYYTSDRISSGLSVEQPFLTLNGKNITIYSGAMHYFRIHPEHWRDRLRKLRAAGMNAVETYFAWNLHEPQNGVFDFGDGGSDMEEFLDIARFVEIAQEEDLFVIARPGPYICSEWEFGGIPSWLLREGANPRTTDHKYFNHVERYFARLLEILAKYQFTRGGPIIAFQVENEYGFSAKKQQAHIQHLYDSMVENDIVELLFTSDPVRSGTAGTIPGVIFQAINSDDPARDFPKLEEMQPGKPYIVMEFYPGWFDKWYEEHVTMSSDEFRELYESTLAYPASVNLYMFYGGTDWGFYNGANGKGMNNDNFVPDTTTYDFDAPLSTAGDYAEKYDIVKELVEKYNPIKTKTPEVPELVERQPYPTLQIDSYLDYVDIIDQAPIRLTDQATLPMEKLSINNNSGQSYGYVVYRQENIDIPADSVLTIAGYISDTLMVLINGERISKSLSSVDDLEGFGYSKLQNSSIVLTDTDLEGATLDLVLENWGRMNYGVMINQYKGLFGSNQVFINDEELTTWTIYPLEFKKSWTNGLTNWKSVDENKDLIKGPGLYKATFTIDSDDSYNYDNFIDLQGWNKGMVFVNGFALGKYCFLGPQQTLYLPRPLLQTGDNEIVILEHFEPATEITFSKDEIYSNP